MKLIYNLGSRFNAPSSISICNVRVHFGVLFWASASLNTLLRNVDAVLALRRFYLNCILSLPFPFRVWSEHSQQYFQIPQSTTHLSQLFQLVLQPLLPIIGYNA